MKKHTFFIISVLMIFLLIFTTIAYAFPGQEFNPSHDVTVKYSVHVYSDGNNIYLPAGTVPSSLNSIIPGEIDQTVRGEYNNSDTVSSLIFGENTVRIIGDADYDGKLTARDARLILRYSAGFAEISESLRDALDFDGDGSINASDARTALKASAGLELPQLFREDISMVINFDETADCYAVASVLTELGYMRRILTTVDIDIEETADDNDVESVFKDLGLGEEYEKREHIRYYQLEVPLSRDVSDALTQFIINDKENELRYALANVGGIISIYNNAICF